ncbi:hypothetical protein HaLaN_26770 [Haematococcus lacustris]|uniref:Uncharacterized protein n=1 Tax=Haematococcus lacustris TaxID=44745 RepID=A0A6A0A7Q2_HAELA|nr:hypothetical protein HaLaN_26770 [Haematococcus lacustris]
MDESELTRTYTPRRSRGVYGRGDEDESIRFARSSIGAAKPRNVMLLVTCDGVGRLLRVRWEHFLLIHQVAAVNDS